MFEVSNTRSSVVFWSVVAVVVMIAVIGIYFLAPKAYLALATEDGIGENLTALLYAIAGILLIAHCFRNSLPGDRTWRAAVLPVLLGLFFIFVAGEEVSWGQRFFGIETPDVIRDNNLQGELNLHNLTLFDKNADLLNQHTALNLFALLFGVVLPLGYFFVPRGRALLNSLHFPIAPLSSCMFFALGIAHSQTLAKLYPHWSHTEVKELVISFGVIVFAISHFTNRNKLPDGDGRAG